MKFHWIIALLLFSLMAIRPAQASSACEGSVVQLYNSTVTPGELHLVELNRQLSELEGFQSRPLPVVRWYQFRRAWNLRRQWRENPSENTYEMFLYVRYLETLKDFLISITPNALSREVIDRQFSKETISDYLRLGLEDAVVSRLRDPFVEFQVAFREFHLVETRLQEVTRLLTEPPPGVSLAEVRPVAERVRQQGEARLAELIQILSRHYAQYVDLKDFLEVARNTQEIANPHTHRSREEALTESFATLEQQALNTYRETAQKANRYLGIETYNSWFGQLASVKETVTVADARNFLMQRGDRYSRDLLLGILRYKVNDQLRWMRSYVIRNVIAVVTNKVEAVVDRFPEGMQNLYYRFKGKTRDIVLFETYKGLLLQVLNPQIAVENKFDLIRRHLQNRGGNIDKFLELYSRYPDEAGGFQRLREWLGTREEFKDYKEKFDKALESREGRPLNLAALSTTGRLIYWAEAGVLIGVTYRYAPELFTGAQARIAELIANNPQFFQSIGIVSGGG